MDTISLYDRRAMLAAIEQNFTPRTFLWNTFCNRENFSDTKAIDVDLVRGRRRMAAFVKPSSEAQLVEKRGFEASTYEPPYIKQKMVTTAADILTRNPGDHVYAGNSSPAQRADAQLGKELGELEDMIQRRQEWMVREALFTGAVTVPYFDDLGVLVATDVVDFRRHADLVGNPAAADLWTATGKSPLEQMKADRSKVSQRSGYVPSVAVLGANAADAFISNKKVTDQLHNRRIDTGQINSQVLNEQGVIYLGYADGIDYYQYDEWYEDVNGVEQPMVPADHMLLGAPKARTVMEYAMIQDLDANASVRYFPKTWTTPDPSARMLMLQSASVPVTHEPDAFIARKVV